MDVQTPYLDAIHAVPGNTPGQKFKWLAKLIRERISECNSLEEVMESDKIPRLLAPLVQVEAARMLMKKEPKDQSNYKAIAEALKSQDATIVKKALQVDSFFDGTSEITSCDYFVDHLFPYVSLRTRRRIIQKLAYRLAPKDPALAQQFFDMIAELYGLKQALPLLLSCKESYMYDTIVTRKIVLSRSLVKRIFRKNPDFVVRYLRLGMRSTDLKSNPWCDSVYDADDILVALIKKRCEAFVELYEMHKDRPPSVALSNKSAEAFLKKGWDHFQRQPRLYIKLIPLRIISATRMEAIFPKLFPDNPDRFGTDQMLGYLKFYPQDKKLDLLLNTHRELYGKSITDDTRNVTVTLLTLLPAEERIRMARIKMLEGKPPAIMDYLRTWRCYLPVDETVPKIKDEIAKTPVMEYRVGLLCQMVYCCRVNNDDAALLEVLTYFRDRHRNEQAMFLMRVFDCLLEVYDLAHASEAVWAVLIEIVVRAHVRDSLASSISTSARILEAGIHFKIIHDEPIDQLIGFFVDLKSRRYSRPWNILEKYPEYERTCLEACLAVVSQRYDSDEGPSQVDKIEILYDLTSSIYHFNESHVSKSSRIERMSIKNYPWLLKEVEKILTATDTDLRNAYVLENFRDTLRKHEKDIYERLCADSTKQKKIVDDIETGKALSLLHEAPEEILANWQEYLKACQDKWSQGSTKRFVRATRWYNEIPVRFAQKCLQDLTKEKRGVSLEILALLVHGQTLVRIIEPLIPTDKTIDIQGKEAKVIYDLTYHVITSARLVNPPVPLQVVGRLCEGDYLSLALSILTNICRRTSTMDVISFAKIITSQRVSVRKHGIRIMCLVASRKQLCDFLLAQWKSEKHYSIREVLLTKASEMFTAESDRHTWSLIKQMISTMETKDTSILPTLIRNVAVVSDEYVEDYIKLLLKTLDDFAKADVAQKTIGSYVRSLLEKITPAICNTVSESFTKELLRRFLFHCNDDIARVTGNFAITAYLQSAKFNKHDVFEERMKTFAAIFAEKVKSGWDVPHPNTSLYYPTNYAVHHFIESLINTVPLADVDPRVMDGMLKAFLAVLTPQMAAGSYLLLVYANERVATKTPKEFGVKIGQRMPELVGIFSPFLVSFMVNTMKYLLRTNAFKDDDQEGTRLGVMEGLMQVGSVEATLMAVQLFSGPVSNANKRRYESLLEQFRKYDHRAIKSALSDVINSLDMA